MTKKFEPTDQQRELVELLVSIGTTQENICQVVKRPTLVSKNGDSMRVKVMVPIDRKTLRRAFREEIATGAIKANAAVGRTMYQMATSGQHPAMTIFWAKTRMGFRENSVVQTQQLDAKGNPTDPTLLKDADAEHGIESSPPPPGSPQAWTH